MLSHGPADYCYWSEASLIVNQNFGPSNQLNWNQYAYMTFLLHVAVLYLISLDQPAVSVLFYGVFSVCVIFRLFRQGCLVTKSGQCIHSCSIHSMLHDVWRLAGMMLLMRKHACAFRVKSVDSKTMIFYVISDKMSSHALSHFLSPKGR